MERRLACALVAVLAVFCLCPSLARAQATGDWASFGFSFLVANEPERSDGLAGWFLSVPTPVPGVTRGRVAIRPVMEFSGSYWRQDGMWVKLHTAEAGVRVRAESARRIRPFAQVLIGGALVDCCGSSGGRLSLDPGAGVDITIPHSASKLRVGVAFPMLFGAAGQPRMLRLQISSTFYADAL
jgi:hypothetical protein